MNTLYIASDHAGVRAKEEIKRILNTHSIEFQDLGPHDETTSVDYPEFAKRVVKKIQQNPSSKGILICGSGTGMAIAANKFDHIRAAFAYDEYSAKMARHDNDANILTLRSREFDHRLYENIVLTFLKTKFSNDERHKRRIKEIIKSEVFD